MTSSSTTRLWQNTCSIFNKFCTLLWRHKLYANLEKYSFSMNRVQYLGYIIYAHGVYVYPANIQVICDSPAPTTLTELQIFLVLANFYRRFVLGFSCIAWSLSQITRGGGKEKCVWAPSQKNVVDDLKQCLCSALVISLPDLQQPFHIETDASYYSVGAVITQHDHPLAYHSETLTDVIYKYPNYEK
jgi:hypothetical protein